MNNATMNMRRQIYLWLPTFKFYMHITKSVTIRLWIIKSIFSILKTHHIVFHSRCIILYSQKQCTIIPIFPHPCQYLFSEIFLLFFVCFDNSHPIECEVIVFQYGFNLVSQIISDVVYPFICLLSVCISLEKCLPKSFAHFFISLYFKCPSSY